VDYDAIKQLALVLGRPAKTLHALSPRNDPFYITPARQLAAKWFAEVWRGLGLVLAHYRRIHYRLVSLAEPVLMANGQPYLNTEECWDALNPMVRDAIYLGLVPPEAFEDRRNAAPLILQQGEPTLAGSEVEDWQLAVAGGFHDIANERLYTPHLPRLQFIQPFVPEPYQVEIWCEKTTVNDVIEPLARRYHLNVQTGVGELSAILCRELVERVQRHRRPTRVLYLSDFDPAGESMPVAVAVKVQFELDRLGVDDLDIQVRPAALTHEQCVEYQLPRTPLKSTETRAARFAERYGEGATELDALEAIHPGVLEQILVEEIERYRDPEHDSAVEAACQEVEDELRRVTDEVIEVHREETAPLLTEFEALQAECDELRRDFEVKLVDFKAKIDTWIERAGPVWAAITQDLEERAPDVSEVRSRSGWLADEDDDPLFDSTRHYVDQVNRFKRHQGKPIEGRSPELSMTADAIRARRRRRAKKEAAE
jgi:hypothetical protein